MDYQMLAEELLRLRGKILRIPASQKLSKMVQGELFVLSYLKDHDEIVHPKHLSENMAVSTARIARLLKIMEEKGLITRVEDLEDSRQVVVRLTEKGRAAIEPAKEDALRCVSELLEKLGPEDAEAYVRIQKRIYQCYASQL